MVSFPEKGILGLKHNNAIQIEVFFDKKYLFLSLGSNFIKEAYGQVLALMNIGICFFFFVSRLIVERNQGEIKLITDWGKSKSRHNRVSSHHKASPE